MDRRNRAARWSTGVLLAAFLAGCGGGEGAGSKDLGAPDVLDEATPSEGIAEAAAEGVADRPDESTAEATDPGVEPDAAQEAELPPPCAPGTTCDDWDPCTVDDQCGDDGTCKGTPVSGCDDQLACTDDTCTGPDQCTHELKAGFCLADGKCYKEGEGEDAKPCVSCITLVATDKLTPDDTLACQDGDACTKGDRCVAGKCIAGPVDCDDKNLCTADSCQAGACVHAPIDGACPGDACVVGGACQAGKCVGTPVDCDDGNLCTADSCDPVAGCQHAPAAGTCDDGNLCTVGDQCEGGQCVPGVDRLKCNDDNACTDDGCVPATGCVYIPNVAPCHDARCQDGSFYAGTKCSKGACPAQVAVPCGDGNACTDDTCDPAVGCLNPDNTNLCAAAKCDGLVHHADAVCAGAACPAQVLTNCDDGNLCTDDKCDPAGGCSHLANSRDCDDGSVCTQGDVCQPDATCKGTAISCDDGDTCTIDSCDAKAGCVHKLDKRPDCRPQIVIDYPPRGATLNADKLVTVLGHVVVSALQDPLDLLTINGQQVLLDPNDNSFQFDIDSAQGMNPIVADISTVTYGAKDHLVQTYLYSKEWYPIDVNVPAQSMVKDGMMIFLGPDVWDSNGAHTDIAGLMEAYVQNLDLSTMIDPNTAVTSGCIKVLGYCTCNYSVYIKGMHHGAVTVDLKPVDGGLYMKAVIADFSADIKIDGCTSPSATATANSITIETTMMVSVGPDGNPLVTVPNGGTHVTIQGLNISVGGSLGFLADWLLSFFMNSLTSQLESSFASALGPQLASAVQKALAGLALNQSFNVPALLPGAPRSP